MAWSHDEKGIAGLCIIGSIITSAVIMAFIGIDYLADKYTITNRGIIKQLSYLELLTSAYKKADEDHDGKTTAEEKIRMYRKIGVPVNFPEQTNRPTREQLEKYLEE